LKSSFISARGINKFPKIDGFLKEFSHDY